MVTEVFRERLFVALVSGDAVLHQIAVSDGVTMLKFWTVDTELPELEVLASFIGDHSKEASAGLGGTVLAVESLNGAGRFRSDGASGWKIVMEMKGQAGPTVFLRAQLVRLEVVPLPIHVRRVVACPDDCPRAACHNLSALVSCFARQLEFWLTLRDDSLGEDFDTDWIRRNAISPGQEYEQGCSLPTSHPLRSTCPLVNPLHRASLWPFGK